MHPLKNYLSVKVPVRGASFFHKKCIYLIQVMRNAVLMVFRISVFRRTFALTKSL